MGGGGEKGMWGGGCRERGGREKGGWVCAGVWRGVERGRARRVGSFWGGVRGGGMPRLAEGDGGRGWAGGGSLEHGTQRRVRGWISDDDAHGAALPLGCRGAR